MRGCGPGYSVAPGHQCAQLHRRLADFSAVKIASSTASRCHSCSHDVFGARIRPQKECAISQSENIISPLLSFHISRLCIEGFVPFTKKKKGVKMLPLGVQQLVAVPLKGHLCTCFTPKRCILVPWNTKTYLKVLLWTFLWLKKRRCNDVLLRVGLLPKWQAFDKDLCRFLGVVRLLNLLIIIKYYNITQSLKTQIKYIIFTFLYDQWSSILMLFVDKKHQKSLALTI